MNNYAQYQSKKGLFIAAFFSTSFFFTACSSSDKAKIEDAFEDAEDNLIEEYRDADGVLGGQMYSKFWADETGFSVNNSELDNQDELDIITANSDFFRCKQCHGWDRLGQEGAYMSRGAKTTRPIVSTLDLARISETSSAQDLYDKIAMSGSMRRDLSVDLSTYDPEDSSHPGNMMPDYSQILTEAQIWDIVKFLKKEALDTTELYVLSNDGGNYPDGQPVYSEVGAGGDASNGDTLYTDTCAGCHGTDGASGSVGMIVDGDDEFSVGWYAREKPYETQHKIKFGHLGSTMTASLVLNDATESEVRDLLLALQDTTKYPDEAGEVVETETPDGAALFGTNCGSCHTGNGMGTGSTGGSITGESFAEIKDAIASVGMMAHLSSLTDPEVQAIADALAP